MEEKNPRWQCILLISIVNPVGNKYQYITLLDKVLLINFLAKIRHEQKFSAKIFNEIKRIQHQD